MLLFSSSAINSEAFSCVGSQSCSQTPSTQSHWLCEGLGMRLWAHRYTKPERNALYCFQRPTASSWRVVLKSWLTSRTLRMSFNTVEKALRWQRDHLHGGFISSHTLLTPHSMQCLSLAVPTWILQEDEHWWLNSSLVAIGYKATVYCISCNHYQGFIRGGLEFPPSPPEILKLSVVIMVLSQVFDNNLVPEAIWEDLNSKFS